MEKFLKEVKQWCKEGDELRGVQIMMGANGITFKIYYIYGRQVQKAFKWSDNTNLSNLLKEAIKNINTIQIG